MIKKPIWIWKDIPSTWSEFWKEVFWLWLGTALVFGVLPVIIIKQVIMLFGG